MRGSDGGVCVRGTECGVGRVIYFFFFFFSFSLCLT